MQANTANGTQNNLKAAIITIAVHAVLLLLFFIVTIAMAVPTPPVVEEGIEVNLGNSDIGFGDIQPLVPGDPAPETQQEQSPPQQQIQQPTDEVEKETSERDDADAPEVTKPEKKVTTPVKNTPVTNNTVTTKKPSTTTVVNPTPAPPKPKAVYTGGTGTGGNNSDTYNNSRNQGIAGGSGDQGKPGGNPNSDNYNGNGGKGSSAGGPRVTSGSRKIVKYYSFEGDLEKATIYAIVKVSPEGKGTFIGFGKNSTSRSQAYATAISNYLRNIQFDKAADESTVTVQFNFKVND
ncbi:MAG: hypothetical protein QM725_02525 [Lacibacter sp.]